MYCRCPHCDTQQGVTTEILRETRGLIRCESCEQSFDALPTLSDQADEAFAPVVHSDLALPGHGADSGRAWGLANFAMLVLLVGQLSYFYRDDALKHAGFYKFLDTLCQAFSCDMPAYHNPATWSVSHMDLEKQLDQRYWLSAALTNQAPLRQSLPALKLSLTDYKGRIVAERFFSPDQYSAAEDAAADETLAIRIPLQLSVSPIGGFTLEAT